jgi:hypothetical protein
MDKSEVRRIVAFLKDVREGLCEGDEVVTMQAQLTELYRVIKRLMDATSATKDQGKKVLFATLELRARQYREELEERLLSHVHPYIWSAMAPQLQVWVKVARMR